MCLMKEVTIHALKDTLIILPFIFIIYVIMEVIENTKNKAKIEKALSGKFAPTIASVVGIVPECGFSVMCAKLYEKGLIRTGTLIAAFMSTSDEGLIVLLSSGVSIKDIATLICLKVLFGAIFGSVLNHLLKKFDNNRISSNDGCLECKKSRFGNFDRFIIHPLFHTLKLLIYLFITNFIFGLLIFFIGEQNVVNFCKQNILLQPIVASIVGIIPNCASSVIIAQTYINGVLYFPGLIAGLTANTGVGILILLKNKKNYLKGITLLSITYFIGVLIGYIVMLCGY